MKICYEKYIFVKERIYEKIEREKYLNISWLFKSTHIPIHGTNNYSMNTGSKKLYNVSKNCVPVYYITNICLAYL